MPIPVRESIPSPDDDYQVLVTDDGSRTLLEVATHNAFHSGCGAVAETRAVYLQNSGALSRLHGGHSTSVLEVGVGTAMALLMTLDAAIQGGAPLRYVGLECRWISAEVLEQLDPRSWVDRPVIVDRYLEWRRTFPDQVSEGVYTWTFDARRHVTIIIGDAAQWTPHPLPTFDAIYFDPFDPESQPDLWSAPMLNKMRSLIDAEGRLVTYCVSRAVRDTMEKSGFTVERTAGPSGGKREVLIARPQL